MADAELLIDEETGEELIITATGEPPLSPLEEAEYEQDRETVINNLGTFVKVGLALKRIKEKRFYRAKYTTFEACVKDLFDLASRRAQQMMQAASVMALLESEMRPDAKDLSHYAGHPVLPKNEEQARALLRAPEEERAAIWQKTVEKYGDKVTAKCVTNVIRDEIGAGLEEKRQKAKREPSEEKKEPHKPFMDAFDEFWRQVNAAYMDDWKKVPKKDVVKRLELILDYIKNH